MLGELSAWIFGSGPWRDDAAAAAGEARGRLVVWRSEVRKILSIASLDLDDLRRASDTELRAALAERGLYLNAAGRFTATPPGDRT